MFQAEVAARLRANPGDSAWGSLSIWIQNRWEVRKLAAVPPGAFAPPPDVNSEVVILQARERNRLTPESPAGSPRTDPRAEAEWEATLDRLLRAAFRHRRKMLRSGLPKNSSFASALDKAEIEGTRRAEELEWAEWQRWMTAIFEISSSAPASASRIE
jgi:16S rRNA (adenine1518-N6/adenine1519-N6)-dimethyltransferase